MACTRSTGRRQRLIKQSANYEHDFHDSPAAAALTADVLPGGTSVFEEGVCEGLARSGLAGPAASHRAHTVVPPGANHRHVHVFDQSSQSRWSVPHWLPTPRLWSLAGNKKKKQRMERAKTNVSLIDLLVPATVVWGLAAFLCFIPLLTDKF